MGMRYSMCFFSFLVSFAAKLEKNIAVEIINNEINVENDVTKKLALILDNHIGRIQKQKRIVTKLIQDNESAKHKYQVHTTEMNVEMHDNMNKSQHSH